MKDYKWPLILIAISTLLIVILTKGKSIMEAATTAVWDYISETRINTLHPAIRNKARQFINQVQQQTGIKLRVTSALRTFDEQNRLYAQGRTTAGKIVTNAKGGQSFHNYGLAIDVVEIRNGAANWSPDWNTISRIAKSLGFAWGGDFSNITDKPHFQYTFGNSIAQLQTKYNAGNLVHGYVILT